MPIWRWLLSLQILVIPIEPMSSPTRESHLMMPAFYSNSSASIRKVATLSIPTYLDYPASERVGDVRDLDSDAYHQRARIKSKQRRVSKVLLIHVPHQTCSFDGKSSSLAHYWSDLLVLNTAMNVWRHLVEPRRSTRCYKHR